LRRSSEFKAYEILEIDANLNNGLCPWIFFLDMYRKNFFQANSSYTRLFLTTSYPFLNFQNCPSFRKSNSGIKKNTFSKSKFRIVFCIQEMKFQNSVYILEIKFQNRIGKSNGKQISE